MWRLNEILAENICSFKELHYVLNQQVTTLVFGNNQDNESQYSNGSGKSALIECIAVGISGSPLRKVKNDEIINDKAGECHIWLQFYNDQYDEVFTIERQLFRKGSSIVKCHIERDGKGITSDEAVHPTIDAYNKYILEKLGITKEELFNNFILSKYKYKDFLNSSDTEKKEIINRFSNASMVDKALEQIEIDQQPLSELYRDAELEVVSIGSRIDMLTEQIEQEELGLGEKAKNKAEKIETIERSIADKRSAIRSANNKINELHIAVSTLEETDKKIQEIEKIDLPLEEYFRRVGNILPTELAGKGTDWEEVISSKKRLTQKLEKELEKWDQAVTISEIKLRELSQMQFGLQEEYKNFSENYTVEVEGYDKQLSDIEKQIAAVNEQKEKLLSERRRLATAIEDIKNKLAGTIVCPACKFKFLASDQAFDVAQAKKDLGTKEIKWNELTYQLTDCDKQSTHIEISDSQIKSSKRNLILKNNDWIDRINGAGRDVNNATYNKKDSERNRQKTQEAINAIQLEVSHLQRKFFDETFGLIEESCLAKERRIKTLNEEVLTNQVAIEVQEKTITEIKNISDRELLANLKKTLKEYCTKSMAAIKKKEELSLSLQELQNQAQIFLQFKSFLANTRIASLGKVTNDFLEAIGSDIRILFSGYTPLKSGKLREKISVSLIREDANCGSFGKISAGEAARVNLATILAMRQLINSNCEECKGLDLLVLDEILDATDESGLANMFDALNRMGLTALVVSHGNIAEGYPHKLIINKHNGESYINDQKRQ